MNAAPSADGHDLAPLEWRKVVALEWSQPERMHRRWELRADGALAATLRWLGPWRRGYVARVAGAEWAVRRSFWGNHSIHRAGDDAVVAAAARSGLVAMTIRRPERESLVWRRENWFGSRHVLENRERFPLFRVDRTRGFMRVTGALHLEDAGRSLPDLEPLVILAWALTVAQARSHAH